MLVKFNADDRNAKNLMELLNIPTAARAYREAAELYQELSDRISFFISENAELKERVRYLEQIIERAGNAAIELVEVVRQRDLLD